MPAWRTRNSLESVPHTRCALRRFDEEQMQMIDR